MAKSRVFFLNKLIVKIYKNFLNTTDYFHGFCIRKNKKEKKKAEIVKISALSNFRLKKKKICQRNKK